MAVQAQASLEPQRVARPKARPGNRLMGEQPRGQCLGVVCRHGKLEAILAGVAGARHARGNAANLGLAPAHEGHVRTGGEHVCRRRPLECQQGAIRFRHHLHRSAQMAAEMSDVVRLARRVDDQPQAVLVTRRDQVVEDAAIFVREQGVAHLSGAETPDIARHQRLQRRIRVRSDQANLAHVAHVKERRSAPRLPVLGDIARRIAQRHLIAGEGRHAGVRRPVHGVERGFEKFGHRRIPLHKSGQGQDGNTTLSPTWMTSLGNFHPVRVKMRYRNWSRGRRT